jgi:RNA polymerase sigma-70 factor, ECF subfamily
MDDTTLKTKFEKTYDAEADSVFRYCLIRTSDREVAMDIAQDTFMKYWKAFLAGKQPDNERAFLFKIARNLVIDWYRSKKSLSLEKIMSNGADEESDGEPFFAHNGKTEFEMEADARILVEKIRDLRPIYQHSIYLRFVEEMRPFEIAEIIGVSANVVSVRITRGLEEIRKITKRDK